MTSILKNSAVKQGLMHLVLITCLILSGQAYADSKTAATITSLSGYVTVTDADGNVRRLKEGDTLEVGHIINTGNDSTVSITLSNGDIITLNSLGNYTVPGHNDPGNNNGGAFAQRTLSAGSLNLSTGTSAGGTSPTTPNPEPPATPPADPTPPQTPPQTPAPPPATPAPGGSPSS